MKKLGTLLLTAAIGSFVLSCSKTEVDPEVAVTSTLATPSDLVLVSTALSGANEVPAVTTTATGAVVGSYNKTSKVLAINITYSGITPTNWHIHKGAAGVAGGVIFAIPTTSFTSPFNFSPPLPLAADQEADLLAGNYYVNLHSAKVASGEIRGNLAIAASAAKGSIVGTFNNSTKILKITVTYSGLTPTAWHIHKGAAGVSGPVVADLGTNFGSPFTFTTTTALTADQEADLKAGLYYVNIHTTAAPGGEIRGQLAVQ